jgi:hypothetical protein
MALIIMFTDFILFYAKGLLLRDELQLQFKSTKLYRTTVPSTL